MLLTKHVRLSSWNQTESHLELLCYRDGRYGCSELFDAFRLKKQIVQRSLRKNTAGFSPLYTRLLTQGKQDSVPRVELWSAKVYRYGIKSDYVVPTALIKKVQERAPNSGGLRASEGKQDCGMWPGTAQRSWIPLFRARVTLTLEVQIGYWGTSQSHCSYRAIIK